jgi:hypothetical protein
MVVILPLSGTTLKSPKQPDLTEWAVCGGRLGVLACIWAVLLFLFCGLRYRGFLLERQMYVESILYTSLPPHHLCSRHRYPEDMYATWASPGPLSDLLPRSTAKPTSGTTSIASDLRMALPPLSQTKRYSKFAHSYPLTSRMFVDPFDLPTV